MISVDDVIMDFDFLESISIQTITPTVSTQGEVSFSTVSTNILAAVQPQGGNLIIFPDGTRLSGFIRVWCKHSMNVASSTTAADVVVYHGNKYKVVMSNDWSSYGAGYFMAVCEFLGVNPS